MTSRQWIFTIHNYSEEDCDRIKTWAETDECKGISAGLEKCPTTGTPHIQGYLIGGQDPVRKTHYYRIFKGNVKTKFFMEMARGSWEENAKYTGKEGNILAFKEPPKSLQGARNDLQAFANALKRGADDDELFENHLRCLAKYPRLEQRIKESVAKKKSRPFRKLEVHVRFGVAGTGKTRLPYEEGAYIFSDYERGWWDGYDGESVVLFDDFYGGVKWSSLLRLLDGYQCRLPIKGGHTYAQWTKVYLTSNRHPSEWYASGMRAELKRRISTITLFEEDGTEVNVPK